MAEAVPCLQDADFGDAAGVALAADAARDDASGIGAQRHDHEVIKEAVILACLGHAELALKTSGFTRRHGGLGHVKPFVRAAGTFFDLTHGGEVFVQLAAVFSA